MLNIGNSRPRYMKAREIAERWGVSDATISDYAKKQFFPQQLPDGEQTRWVITEEMAKLDMIPGEGLFIALIAPPHPPKLVHSA